MFICGSSFCGGELACAFTPSQVDGINYVELKNGIYDDLYISKSTKLEPTSECPENWDFDTVLYARFNNTTNAGNVDWNLETVTEIILKKRLEGTFPWSTIYVKKIESIHDFMINYNDYLTQSGAVYEYAVVPISNGVEGNYSISKVKSSFDGLFLIENDTVYSTTLTDGFCDTTRNIPSQNVVLLNQKYPVFIKNSIANYDTGTCSGGFLPVPNEDSCEFTFSPDTDYERTSFQRDVMDFICDGVPKILKISDGRMWIIQVTPNPTDSANSTYNNRKISFSFTSIGDIHSEEDLFYLGFSDVDEKWWCK